MANASIGTRTSRTAAPMSSCVVTDGRAMGVVFGPFSRLTWCARPRPTHCAPTGRQRVADREERAAAARGNACRRGGVLIPAKLAA